MYRALRWCVLVATGYVVVAALPSLARYLRIRSM
jgi:hypothetical protein